MIPHVDQILLFSATFPTNVITYAQQFCPDANEIKLRQDELSVEGIKQMFMDASTDQEKYEYLVRLYDLLNNASSIIFVKVKKYSYEWTSIY